MNCKKGKVVFYTSLLESGLCPDFKTYRLSLFRDFQIYLSGLPAKRLDRALSEQLVPMGKEGLSHAPTRNQRPWSTRIYRHHVKVRARDQGNVQACSFYATKKDQRHPQCETLHTATTLLTRYKGTQSARLSRDHPSEQLKHQNTDNGRAFWTFGPFKN